MKLKGIVEVKEKRKIRHGNLGEEGDGQKSRDMCRKYKKNKAENYAQNARQTK